MRSRPHARRWHGNIGDLRRGDRDHVIGELVGGDEHGEYEAGGTSRAGGDESTPAVLVELLAHGLVGMPSSSPRSGHAEANSGESSGIGEVGNLQGRDLVAPQVARQRAGRRDGCFGEVAIPLGPDASLVFSEVQGVEDRAALPSVIAGRAGASEWVDSSWDVAPPPTSDRRRVDIEGQPGGLRRRRGTRGCSRGGRRLSPRRLRSPRSEYGRRALRSV